MSILVVDDHADVIISIKEALDNMTVIGADTPARAWQELNRNPDVELAILDVRLGEEDGLELLAKIREQFPAIECVMISGYSTVEKAVAAVKMGAFDFLEKPLSYQKLKVVIRNALERRSYSSILRREMERYRLAGESPAIGEVNHFIDKAAASDFPVLIQGESGVGKEHVAHLIYLKSKRNRGEMVKLNCAAFPENLFESELFGYEKGAFTGAQTSRRGKIECAQGGVLFLDEIGEMPLSQQAKLLRVLEDGEVSRLGSDKKIKVDFRLVCATNRDLKQSVKEGKFREDLFYRLGVIMIRLPSLRERREDISLLAREFLEKLTVENGGPRREWDSGALQELETLPLRGNVRELKNLVQRLYVFSSGDTIRAKEVKQLVETQDTSSGGTLFEKTMPLSEAKNWLEKQYIEKQLQLHSGNISQTALALGILPNNLSRKIKQLGIKT